MKLVQSFCAAATLLLCSAGAASAGTTHSGGSFCGVSKGVASELVNLQKQLQSAPSPTRLKAEFGAITAAEPSLKSSAPGSLKAPVKNLLSLANEIAADLKAGN